MKDIFKKLLKNIHKNESGTSIVIALGITALLIGLSLTYIITTQTEKKASVNFNNLKISKMFAESGLRRCLASMQVYSAETGFDLGTICSHKFIVDQSLDSEPYFVDLNTVLPTSVNGVSYYEWPSNYNAANPDAVTWIYIKDGNKIIGRIAYAVVPDKGKLDPSVVVDSGGNGVPYTEGNMYTLVKPDGSKVTGRPGQYIQELYLNTLSSWFENDSAVAMSADNATPNVGKLTHNTRWQDFSEIFTNLSINNSDIEDSFRKVFSLYSPKDPEAFWVDLSNNQYKESSELFHRFDLTRNNWDDFDVDSIVADSIIPFSTKYSESDVTALPWIKNWKHPGTDTLSDTMSRQIAANLIDYCDTNDSATTDDQNNPTYVGLEDCPYINEIKIQFSGEMDASGNSFISAESNIETIYTYQNDIAVTPFDANIVLKISGSYTASYTNGFIFLGIPIPIESFGFVETFSDIELSCTDLIDARYKLNTIPISEVFTSTGNESGTILYRAIDNFKITEIKIKLIDSLNLLYDFSYLVDSSFDSDPDNSVQLYYWMHEDVDAGSINAINLVISFLNIFFEPDIPTIPVGSTTGEHPALNYLYCTVNDPKQNLNVSDWESSFSLSDPGDTFGSKNSNCNINSGVTDDEAAASEPWEVSTAYIRNGPMKSPWELGFIHRAAPWQTINLKKYNSSEGNNITSGGNQYSDGDANILDQIKMTSETEAYGKININTDISDVLKVLYEKIYVGSDISSVAGPGDQIGATEINTANAQYLVSYTLSDNGTNGGSVFNTRAQIVRNSDGVDELTDNTLSVGQTTDATQEEIIGKFINLTKASQPNIFHVICLGESIKDLGGVRVNNIDTHTGTFDIGADEMLRSYKIMAVVKLDSSNNKVTILRFYILTN